MRAIHRAAIGAALACTFTIPTTHSYETLDLAMQIAAASDAALRPHDGRTYRGDVDDAGRPHGDGIEIVPGDPPVIFRGTWRAGLRHGIGTETVPRGLARRCRWDRGVLVHDTCSGLGRDNRRP